MRISDWSSDVCSSDLAPAMLEVEGRPGGAGRAAVCRGSGGAGRGVAVTRGDIVAVSLQGDYGKPRPALIVQSNLLAALESVVICPTTSAVRDAAFRITVAPDNANGLRVLSQVMVDNLSTLPRPKIRQIGQGSRREKGRQYSK